ncbi:U3 small nucleolar RNA-associated protein 13 [Lecanora helva]
MASRTKITTTYEAERLIQPIYTGGDVALDREGQILATCLGEEALLTELCTGVLLARIEGDGEVLTTISLTPTASHLVTCSRSLSMQIYALRQNEGTPLITPTLLRTLKPHTTPVIIAAIDDSGTLLATGGADGIVKVWDIRDGYVTHTFRGHTGVISALHFFKVSDSETEPHKKKDKDRLSGKHSLEHQELTNGHNPTSAFRLASGSEDGKIRIWNLARRKSIATLDSHISVIRGLEYSGDANILISGSRDKTVILWDAHSWRDKRTFPVLEEIEAVGFLNRGRQFYTGGKTGRLRIWHVESGSEITKDQGVYGESDAISHIIRVDTTKILLSIHADQSLLLHSTSSLSAPESAFDGITSLPILRRISGTHDEIIDLAYVTPDNSLLALATNSESIRLVSLANSIPQASPLTEANYFGADVALLQGHEDIVICLSVDSSGCWLATGSKDNTARLWKIDHSLNSYQHHLTFTGHAESIGAVCIKSTAPVKISSEASDILDNLPKFLLTGSQDRTIKRWNIPRPDSSKESAFQPSQARALYTRKAHDKDINAIALSPNGNIFASASQDRMVKIWSTEEGEVQGILRGHRRGVWSVAFAPKDTPSISSEDGSVGSSRGLVLTGSGDKTVKIWSLNDYSCLRTFEGHTNSVLKVIWVPIPPPTPSPDDESAPRPSKRPPQIASAGGDGLLKVWDATTGEVATTLDNHTDRIWALTANPETGMLVSGGGDSVVTFWKDTSTETAAKTSAAATQRVEQDQELQNYIHRGRYREAITLALALNHPGRLLSLFTNVINTSPSEENSISGVKAVDEVISTLTDEQLLSLLFRVRDWNTNARTSPVAQRVLNVVVRSYPAGRLAGLGKRKGGKEVIEALRVYTERHYRRVEELWGESWLVECLLGEMDQLGLGDVGIGEEKGEVDKDVIMV